MPFASSRLRNGFLKSRFLLSVRLAAFSGSGCRQHCVPWRCHTTFPCRTVATNFWAHTQSIILEPIDRLGIMMIDSSQTGVPLNDALMLLERRHNVASECRTVPPPAFVVRSERFLVKVHAFYQRGKRLMIVIQASTCIIEGVMPPPDTGG